VRWRLVSAASGAPAPGCLVSSDGRNSVSVEQVELVVRDPGGNVVTCDSCRFPCAPLEGTTRFSIPEGSYSFAVRGIKCGGTVGFSTPAVVRAIRAGGVTNLNAIEILIPQDEPSDDQRQGCDAGQ
jgi:hypothetical protein